ncbi:hypothetical protein E2C01_009435 [Portunus trituberculatus]|uniref:Uncharacterized protein n=1 Tax=Portunus trituberculatus TaxID=210409 RepID=A0A5B7D5J7_PORTR|nr:hypothetical protein [Portunus trituberculatus]
MALRDTLAGKQVHLRNSIHTPAVKVKRQPPSSRPSHCLLLGQPLVFRSIALLHMGGCGRGTRPSNTLALRATSSCSSSLQRDWCNDIPERCHDTVHADLATGRGADTRKYQTRKKNTIEAFEKRSVPLSATEHNLPCRGGRGRALPRHNLDLQQGTSVQSRKDRFADKGFEKR